MTEIPTPPSAPFCASCNEQVVWLYSASKEAWVAFVPCGCGARFALRPHPCRHAQDPATWRALPHGDPPSAVYVEIKKQIASREPHHLAHQTPPGEDDPNCPACMAAKQALKSATEE